MQKVKPKGGSGLVNRFYRNLKYVIAFYAAVFINCGIGIFGPPAYVQEKR